jgi:8-oxo-dGTP pyrophosphatase MutT (NUDIX family)
MLTVLTAGDWGPDDVDVKWVPGTRRLVPEVEELIERAWHTATARAAMCLFDGPMCRLEGWGVSPDGKRLKLSLSHTSYKPFFGTNMSHPELFERYGPAVMANPVGVSPALETADGFLLLGRRNAAVAYYPERVHPFAGALEPDDNGDLFAAVRRELNEEVSLQEAELGQVRCTGIVLEQALRQNEFIFRARTTLSRRQVELRLDRQEHRATYALPATQEGVEEAIKDPQLTPVAVATLLLWGRHRFGEAWFIARST